MRKLFFVSMGFISLFLTAGYQQKIDVANEKAEILKLYELQRQALLKGDVDAILSLIPEGHERISVGRGKISKTTKADTKQNFEMQFKHGRYVEANYLTAPAIKISPDGKMAWVVGQLKYKYTYKDSTGAEHEFGAVDAWLSVLEKRNSQWVESAEAETFDKGE
jgi:hypothetical protein